MPRGFFVTGTDTGVGKTVVSAALVSRVRTAGPVRYWKPIQTGTDDDTAEVCRLAGCASGETLDEGIRLPAPMSPHLAARLAGQPIDFAQLTRIFRREADADPFWVVEGAGGVLVPITDEATMADLMAALGLPILVVARTSLGTINHTRLTLEALRARRLEVAGVVMVGVPDGGARETIARHARIVGEMPPLTPLTPQAVAAAAAALDLGAP